MIKLVRVDHRLIHGQVAFSWTKFLDSDCILCASDALMDDTLKMSALRMAAPSGVKLVMKSIDDSIAAINAGVTDKYKLFIVCESIADVARLTAGCPVINAINLGGTKSAPDRKQISKGMHLSDEDITLVKAMVDKGLSVTVQLVPDDTAVNVTKLISG